VNAFQSISAGMAQLKNFYQGPIVSQLNDDVGLYRGAEKGKEGWSGYQVVRPLKVRRNQGIGATSDGGPLPKIGRQTSVQATITSAFNYLRFGITGPMIKASQSNVGSFVRSAAYELEEGYKDLKTDLNRQSGWDGSGNLALVNTAAVASNTLVIKGRESTEEALKFVDVDLTFDIVDTNGAYKAQAVTVNSISAGGPSDLTATIILDQVVTCAVGDRLIRSGALGQEMSGLLYALDGLTTTIYGVNRSTYQSYQGNVLDNANAQLTLDYMQRLQNEAERRGGGKISAIWCDYNTRRMYQKLLTADKRYVNTMKGDGGFADKDKSYLEFNGVALVADKDFATRLVFLPESGFKKYVLAEMEFADETGSMYIAQSGADALEVRIRMFANYFNEKPASFACGKSYTSP